MKSLLLFILLFLSVVSLSQDLDIESILYEGRQYWLYPERQKIRYNPTTLIWEKEIRLSRKELRKYKWGERRYFRKDLVVTSFPEDGGWLQLFEGDEFMVAKEFEVVNGLPEGRFRRYNEYGDLVEEGEYKNGNRSGKFVFYPDSSRYEMEYAEGRYDMADSTYYKVGLFPYFHIIQEGKQGKWEYRRRDSSLYLVESYHHGRLDGKSLGYYRDSTFSHDFNFEDGEMDGVQKSWHRNGQIWKEVNYSRGIKEGTYKSWYEDGEMRCNLEYIEDKILSGKCTLLYDDGSRFGEGILEDGVRLGTWTFWHKNGELRAQGTYQDHVTDVCISGRSRPYRHSVPVGEWSFWYSEGRLLAKGKYMSVKKRISRGEIFVGDMVEHTWDCKDAEGNDISCDDVIDLLSVEER